MPNICFSKDCTIRIMWSKHYFCDWSRPPDLWVNLNFALVEICSAIKSQEPVKMGPKEPHKSRLCYLSLPPQKKEKKNTIGELILSQAQSFVSYGRSSSALYTFVRHGRKKLVGALCSIFSLFGLVLFLIAVIAKKLGLKLNCKERHLGVSMVCLTMHLWCNFM